MFWVLPMFRGVYDSLTGSLAASAYSYVSAAGIIGVVGLVVSGVLAAALVTLSLILGSSRGQEALLPRLQKLPLTRDTFCAISELVRSLALARQSHSRIQSLTQPETVAQIRAALQRRDGDAIERLLEPLREHADDDPVQTANLCIFLLQILHGVPRETDFSSYRTKQMELMALPTCAQRVEYVCACYAEAVAAPAALSDIVERIRRLVLVHYNEPDFNISILAQEMHFSPAYLGRLFAEQTGGSLLDYILEQRMKRACDLLSRTLMPIV